MSLTDAYVELAKAIEEHTGSPPKQHLVSFEVYSRLWFESYKIVEELVSPDTAKWLRLQDRAVQPQLMIHGVPVRAMMD